jgi:hypothetical protein
VIIFLNITRRTMNSKRLKSVLDRPVLEDDDVYVVDTDPGVDDAVAIMLARSLFAKGQVGFFTIILNKK